MLSIGIVASGGVDYYMSTVGSGVDDYYASAEPGRWTGSAAAEIGLSGEVRGDQVDALAQGRHPLTGDRLGVRVGKVAAFDLTFSAPKGVSLLTELGDDTTRHQTLEAHRAAVEATLRFIESEGVLVARRGLGGSRQVPTRGAVAAAFDHRTSRAGDPQLHTHLLVFNRAPAIDGRWGGIHGRRLFAWAKTAGYVYQAALRAELSERMGVAWHAPVNGMAEIAGIPDGLLEEFSTRRAEIEAALSVSGHTSAKAAQVATLATRAAKPEPMDPHIQREEWAARARSAGLDSNVLDIPHRSLEQTASGHRVEPRELTEHRSFFDRRDLLQALAHSSIEGARPEELTARAAALLADEQIVALGTEHPLAGPLYSTTELLELEARILDAAERTRDSLPVCCPGPVIQRAITERPSLSAEQEQMVRHLCSSTDGVLVVLGRAGTGKTFALDACRQAWTSSGATVIGAALAARTAAGLQSGTGIPSTTVDQLLTDLARPGAVPVLPRNSVLVVDEAGMVGTRKLAALLHHAERHRTRVVLVGDPRQLPEVEAGGAFAALARHDAVELTANRRQANPWEREALAQLRHGSVAQAVTVYRDNGRITLAATADDARARLVDDWWAARDTTSPDRCVMIALHQVDVDDLNTLARGQLKASGYLQGPELEASVGKAFTQGDEVVTLRNDRRLGVTNGTRAQVTGVDPDNRTVTVETRDGRIVMLPGEYIDAGYLTHGYALTAHKAQGITVDRAFVLGSERMYREAGYTSLSRATQRTDLYHVAPPQVAWQPATNAHDALTSTLSRSAAQSLASDHLTAVRDAALADPGQHLIERLGPPPPSGSSREMWAAAATAIEEYRNRYGISADDALGPRPEPTDRERTRAYEHVETLASIIDRHQELGLEPDRALGL